MALLIFILSLLLHASLVSKGPVSIDCLSLALKSQETLNTGQLQYLFGSGYPLMVLLGAFFTSIGKLVGANDPVSAVNGVSVIFGSLAVAIFFLFVDKISNTLTAVIAAFLLLLNPIFLDVSTYGLNHALCLCLCLMGFLALAVFQDQKKWPLLVLSGFCFGLMGAARLQDCLLLFPALSLLFFLGSKKNGPWDYPHKLRTFVIFTAIILLTIAVLHLPYFLSGGDKYKAQLKDFWHEGLTDSYLGFVSPYLLKSLPYFIKTFTVVGILFYAAGVLRLFKTNRKLLALTVIWWVVPLEFYANHLGIAPRFLTTMLPAFIIPMSMGLAVGLRLESKIGRAAALFAFLAISILPFSQIKQTLERRHHDDLIGDYYRWVGTSTQPNAVIITTDDAVFIDQYSHRRILYNPQGIHPLTSDQLSGFKRELDRLLDERCPVYVTQMGLSSYDFYGEFRELMTQYYRLKWIGKKPFESWYQSPFSPPISRLSLLKVEKK